MPTLEEILESRKENAKIKVEYNQNGSAFLFRNITPDDGGCLYSWVVLLSEGRYQKVYATKYTASAEFAYNFADLEPRTYKIRAFMKTKNGEKSSQDVAFIRKNDDGSAVFLENLSIAAPMEGED